MANLKFLTCCIISVLLSICVTTYSQEFNEATLDTLQDTMPHCGTIKSTGPLCSTSDAKARQIRNADYALQKVKAMLEQYKQEKAEEEAKERQAKSPEN